MTVKVEEITALLTTTFTSAGNKGSPRLAIACISNWTRLISGLAASYQIRQGVAAKSTARSAATPLLTSQIGGNLVPADVQPSLEHRQQDFKRPSYTSLNISNFLRLLSSVGDALSLPASTFSSPRQSRSVHTSTPRSSSAAWNTVYESLQTVKRSSRAIVG